MRISAIILTKNEERTIQNAVQSVSFCDEILVIDDASQDGTEKKAKEAGAVVLSHSLNNNFSEQRNWSMKQAKNEWILFLDGDEEVSDTLKSNILNSNFENTVSAYAIPRRDYFWDTELKHGETKEARTQGIIRLIKKNSGEWRGQVHEKFVPKESPGFISGFINHYAHETLSTFITDINKYSSLRASELAKKDIQFSLIQLILFPFAKFINTYFLKKGFLDGPAGFVYSFVMAFHSFLVRAKLAAKSYV